MPGIVGIIGSLSPDKIEAAVENMVRSMAYEPFYTTGKCFSEKMGVGAGWICHEGSFADCQPIWNESHDICLIFAGEHFSDASEIASLTKAGHQCPAEDASYLVHLYEEQGMKFFESLNGTFSGLVLDLREKKAVLFNDRFGLGRLYYHENKDGFFFASEAKALLKVVPQLRRLDMESFGEFVSCECPLQDRTLFAGISLLPPGSTWTFRPSQAVEKKQYFIKDAWERQSVLSAPDYYAELKGILSRILPAYFRGKQKVGLSLTGGLDSRVIIAAAPCPPETLPCYTFGGTYRDCEDVRLARIIAARCHQPYKAIPVDQNFFPHFMDLAQRSVYYTDGALDVTGSVGLYANRKSRELALVRMTGNYGSEILRGNVAFKASSIYERMFVGDFVPQLRRGVETYHAEKKGSVVSFIAFKQVPWFHFGRLAEEQSQLTIRSPYLDNELVRLAYQAPPGLLLNKQLAYRFTTDVKPALSGIPTDRGMLECPPFVPNKLFQLAKEVRPRLEYHFDYGMPHWLAKVDRVVAPLHLERLFLGQQKYYHFRMWYRHQLAKNVQEVLLDPRTLSRPYLNRQMVEKMVTDHVQGKGNYTLEIHKLLTSEFIQRQLIEMV